MEQANGGRSHSQGGKPDGFVTTELASSSGDGVHAPAHPIVPVPQEQHLQHNGAVLQPGFGMLPDQLLSMLQQPEVQGGLLQLLQHLSTPRVLSLQPGSHQHVSEPQGAQSSTHPAGPGSTMRSHAPGASLGPAGVSLQQQQQQQQQYCMQELSTPAYNAGSGSDSSSSSSCCTRTSMSSLQHLLQLMKGQLVLCSVRALGC